MSPPLTIEAILDALPEFWFANILTLRMNDGKKGYSVVIHDTHRGATVGTSEGPHYTVKEALAVAIRNSNAYTERHGVAAKPIRKIGSDEIPGISYVKSIQKEERAAKKILPRSAKPVPKVPSSHPPEPPRPAFGRRLNVKA